MSLVSKISQTDLRRFHFLGLNRTMIEVGVRLEREGGREGGQHGREKTVPAKGLLIKEGPALVCC